MRRALDLAAPLLLVALLLGIWEALCRLLDVPSFFLPTPSSIAVALAQNAPLLSRECWLTIDLESKPGMS